MNAIRFAACVWLLVASAAAAQSRTASGHAPWNAPQRAASMPNPLASRPELAAGGRKIFEERCATCHGTDALGTNRGPSLLARRVQSQTDGTLFWKISSGNTRTGMPTFSLLPPLERWQLVLHLRSLAKHERP